MRAALTRYIVLALSLPAIALIGLVDALIDPHISLALFYLLPVTLLAWNYGRIAGVLGSIGALAVESYTTLLAIDPQQFLHIELWNTIGRLGFYIIIVALITHVRGLYDWERNMARRDFLTGLHNSRWFYRRAELEIDRARRAATPLTIAYFDVDGFKQVNDRMGHPEGDRLLKAIASALGAGVRRIDMAARLGGDEFAVLLPLDDFPAAQAAIARIRERLLDTVRETWPVTFSVGAITYAAPPSTVSAMVTAADELMYGVKKSGKNDIRHITKD